MKWIKNITVASVGILSLLVLQFLTGESIKASLTTEELIDKYVYADDQVLDVNITIEPEIYQEMLDNAMSEEMVMANITYDDVTLESVGLRPKGNSSLQQVFQSGDDRFSFKVDLNEYIEGQNLYGLEKFNLNNLFEDPSMMAEYLTYEMLEYLGAPAPRTAFIQLSINGSYFGLYLAVEQVDENFLVDHFERADGVLYKPDMGLGSDLVYDDSETYTGLYDQQGHVDNNDKINTLMLKLSKGESIDDIFNVDGFLKYLAVSSMVIHYDSYQGGMFHNYYLFDNDDVWEWIGWDFNMTFNGFPMSNMTDDEAITSRIDEPVLGSMDQYPLLEAIMGNEGYVNTYHGYIEDLIEGMLNTQAFTNKVMKTKLLIDPYVQNDPSKFFTYDAFLEGVAGDTGLISFMDKRVNNVVLQLSGDLASTNMGQGNIGSSSGKQGGQGMKGENDMPGGDANNTDQPMGDGQEGVGAGEDQPSEPPEGGPMTGDGQEEAGAGEDQPSGPPEGGPMTGDGQEEAGAGEDQLSEPPGGGPGMLDLETLLYVVNEADIPSDILDALSNKTMVDKRVMDAFIEGLTEDQRLALLSDVQVKDQGMNGPGDDQMNTQGNKGEGVSTNISAQEKVVERDSIPYLWGGLVFVLAVVLMKKRRR